MKNRAICIVGPGRLGSALAVCLQAAGYQIAEVVFRGTGASRARVQQLARSAETRAVEVRRAKLDADIVWFCVPDSQIAPAAEALAGRQWKGKIALHSSGVLSSNVLAVLKSRGASVASVHPLMTFALRAVPDLRRVPFAIEGDAKAVQEATRVARRLGGEPFRIPPEQKPPYHALATMICPLLTSLLAVSEEAAKIAGMSRSQARTRMFPILLQTLMNYEKLGAAGAFTGPFVRGDIETMRLHLRALEASPRVRDVYVALANAALQFLPHHNAVEMRKVLNRSRG